jgi:hypothetical protein
LDGGLTVCFVFLAADAGSGGTYILLDPGLIIVSYVVGTEPAISKW